MMISQRLETNLSEASRDATSLRLMSYAPDVRQNRHAHNYASITLILVGGVEECAGGSTSSARQGWVGLKAPGWSHACHFASDTTRTLQLQLSADSFETNLKHLSPLASQWRPAGGLVGEMLALLRLQHAPPCAKHAVEVAERVLDLLAAFPVATNSTLRSTPPWLPRMCEALAEDDAPVGDLARECGVHRVHFARIFRRHVGMPPARYRSAMRILRIIHSLQSDPKPLAALAAAEGFADQSHMIRSVRTATGLTPVAWRRLAQ